ncbi:protein of unknown function [Kyrpidia spormannii]|uniref:Uncharacterized protein n=2 Tax=Kyrpidia spormannii TaxID=2055160 RepID=A0ACA8ZEL9_9BACL|nr:protein of unknown function [Kyrpidia spormannii]CAB3396285.1 protein of unknown function [Kyrpidia spormannii]
MFMKIMEMTNEWVDLEIVDDRSKTIRQRNLTPGQDSVFQSRRGPRRAPCHTLFIEEGSVEIAC